MGRWSAFSRWTGTVNPADRRLESVLPDAVGDCGLPKVEASTAAEEAPWDS
jgi:hypothetical protein